MDAALRDRAAGWLAEAYRTGEPVAPMPYEVTPRSQKARGHRPVG